MDIRSYIKNNFKESNIDEIKSSIVNSINEQDEITLPGLGVFFEVLWQNSEDKFKDDILQILVNNI